MGDHTAVRARVRAARRRRLGRPHCSGMVGVAWGLSIIIGWPITGRGRGQGAVSGQWQGGVLVCLLSYPTYVAQVFAHRQHSSNRDSECLERRHSLNARQARRQITGALAVAAEREE